MSADTEARLTALAERVEGLDGPCRETDRMCARAFGWFRVEPRFAGNRHGGWIAPEDFIGADPDGRPRLDSLRGTTIYRDPPAYTSSIDAVVALIEKELPGWAWKVGTCCVSDDGLFVPDFNCPKHGERLRKQFGDFAAGSPEDTGIDVDKRPSGTPAIALLAAFLRGYALHLSTTGRAALKEE